MNPLAEQLNETIRSINPYVLEMLSDAGKRLYFPKGILSQSAEAKVKATRFNATIGTAMSNGQAMALPCVTACVPGFNPNDILLYAPSPGLPGLRQAWKEKLLHDNPSMATISTSLPIVTSGLTHGLSLISEMFCNEGDALIYPDMNWGNYALNYVVRRGLVPCYFPFFKDGGFNLDAFKNALATYSQGRDKVIVLLNFPNNPSGYTPTEQEGDAIARALVELAESGTNVVAIIDDAYYGLFFDDVMKESLFTKIAGRHERLLAIKADAATKEVYVWGLRIGFVTVAVKSEQSPEPLYEALNAKLGGCVRSVISNCSALSQQIVLKALKSPSFYEERAANVAIIRERAQKVHEVLRNPKYSEVWEPYPFNSGYFMCIRLKHVNAEALRVHMLDAYGIGTIAVGPENIRIAFSCLEVENVQELFDLLYKGAKELES
ncbi:MAG: aminotransferase class I/II-fold pyridoxal phosphate-dependent enzyme [Victivallales bacterium]|nr:aminotransferase class I/II-fold pyridoxal phosphate-dependent enzyme [Victivallales bacterium]